MDELEFLGYLVSAIVTLGSFIAVIMKFVQPINELRVLIQKLLDKIDVIELGNNKQDEKINKHSDEIKKLDNRVGTLETKVSMYHNKDSSI